MSDHAKKTVSNFGVNILLAISIGLMTKRMSLGFFVMGAALVLLALLSVLAKGKQIAYGIEEKDDDELNASPKEFAMMQLSFIAMAFVDIAIAFIDSDLKLQILDFLV